MIFSVLSKHFLVWQMPQLFSHLTNTFLVVTLSLGKQQDIKTGNIFFKEGFLRGLSGGK